MIVHGVGPDRGVSTVIDVAMALLLVTASVAILGYALADTGGAGVEASESEPTVVADASEDGGQPSAAHVTDVLAGSTISVTYDLESVRDDPRFSEPAVTTETTYERTDHGSPLGLLATAAVTNRQLDGEQVLAYGDDYEGAVDWAIRQSLLGTESNVYAVATWEPYDDAAINGTATAGERPPPDADVSSTTTTVPSGLDPVDEDDLEDGWLETDAWWDDWVATAVENASDVSGIENPDERAYAAAGTAIGEPIVDGLFPPESMQYALEDQGIQRELALYHYQSTVDAVGEFSFRDPDRQPPLARSDARAERANHRVLVGQDGGFDVTDADALAAWIGSDLQRTFADEFAAIDEQYDGTERDERKVAVVLEALSTEDVTITVQTWHE